MKRPPMLVIAGTNSGAGKTSTALALTRALARRGLRVQTFKVGPDFLDPTWLALASGRNCYNLDGWMAGTDYSRRLFDRTAADADFVIVEGVMGLFDGANPQSSEGATAEIARLFDIPILLVANVHGMARSFAALVKGFTTFEPDLRFFGVIANHCGSERHAQWLSLSLAAAGLPPLTGAIPRGAFPEIPSRHLGLVTAERSFVSESFLDAMADVIEKYADIEKFFPADDQRSPFLEPDNPGASPSSFSEGIKDTPAQDMKPVDLMDKIKNDAKNAREQKRAAATEFSIHATTLPGKTSPVRIGLAMDEAFHFYYADMLDALRSAGMEIAFFSPLNDSRLPENISGLYLGGGYPELYAGKLESNGPMLKAIRRYADSGRPLYAECGGLMYLSRGIETQGVFHPLCGILPTRTRMRSGRTALGYVEATLTDDSLWGSAGDTLRGHEFHYSELIDDPTADSSWQRVYQVRRRMSEKSEAEGFQRGAILASYLHLHLASRPGAITHFINQCGGKA